MDGSLSGSGERNRRTRQPCRSSGTGDGDMDTSAQFTELVKKDKPRRSLSGELGDSLVIGEKGWSTMNTVHKAKFDNFDDSESLMDDSFAGSSFASTQDSFCIDDGAEGAKSQFTTLDDEPPSSAPAGKGGPSPRKNTPRRTYSKQRKTMPKKSAPMSAISEDENDSAASES